MNERDSEIIAQLLHGFGFIPVSDMDTADLIVLNTCSIRAKAEQKVYSLLGQLRQYKLHNPNLLIGVAGCVAQQEGEKILHKMPHVDLVVGTQQIYRLPEMIRQLDNGEQKPKPAVGLTGALALPSIRQLAGRTGKAGIPFPASRDYKKFVTIMQGCNNFCSYCVVPYTRGREVSRPVVDILDEVNLLVSRGVREITLLGQNVNSYGQTNSVAEGPVDFSALLRMVARAPGLRRLRFTTSNPKDLSDELMRCFVDIDILCPNFHLPVQSGSDRILRRMNRKYTVADYLDKVGVLRQYRSDITLSTDVIVGFPGETDEDFQQTIYLLENVRFDSSFSFKYSDRPGTRSAAFADKVDEKAKSARLALFQARQDSISLERNREYVDRVLEVMVEGTGKNNLLHGRSAANHIIHFAEPPGPVPRPGEMVMVRINQAGHHSLAGTVLKEDPNV
jgi:tRNA-2-methylthio-N6-dimethylallyladenosine synthase